MSQQNAGILETRKLNVSVPGRTLVDALDFCLRRGEFVAMLGRNGSGKTLSMLTLAALRNPTLGNVILDGDDVFSMPRATIARRLALLPQSVDDIFPATVLDTVLIGRHPHIPRFHWESKRDREVAMNALQQMDIADLAERDVLTLSGGERRRLGVAQILAQAPAVYLLDEPTNHLDPQHQLDVLQVFRHAANDGASVVASLHDVNLAVRFADRCLLLFGDGRWELGATSDILNERRLEALYGTPIEALPWRSRQLFIASGNQETNRS
jgi:iron complex transport system ATP-binding protein